MVRVSERKRVKVGKFSGWLLVADFDDTLRPEDAGGGAVPRENLRAVDRFIAEGGRFTVATGRDLCSYLHICSLFPHNAPVILSNGAVLYDPQTQTVLSECFLPPESCHDLRQIMETFPDAGVEVHRGREVSVCRENECLREHLRRMDAPIRPAEPEEIALPWNKVVLLFPGSVSDRCPEAHDAAAWIVERFFGRYEAVPSGALVDMVAAGCDKGRGVLRLAELLNVDRERLVCVGDSWNDLPMLRTAGRAFAPAGAAESILEETGVTAVGPCPVCLRDVLALLEREIS